MTDEDRLINAFRKADGRGKSSIISYAIAEALENKSTRLSLVAPLSSPSLTDGDSLDSPLPPRIGATI